MSSMLEFELVADSEEDGMDPKDIEKSLTFGEYLRTYLSLIFYLRVTSFSLFLTMQHKDIICRY